MKGNESKFKRIPNTEAHLLVAGLSDSHQVRGQWLAEQSVAIGVVPLEPAS